MIRSALLLALAAAMLGGGAHAASIEDRIDQGLNAGATPAPPAASETPTLGIAGPPPDDRDVSLDAPSGPHHLRTTLDPAGIGTRIDKGMTAAGEESAVPPDFAFGAFQRGWFLTAFALALDRAKAGDAKAQTLLGVLLSRGLGVKQDLAAAADWYRLAGNGGDPEALYALGQLYVDGTGVPKDLTKAAEFFRQAADADQPGAARELGYLLLQGNGIEKNAMLAGAYLRRAAGLGDMDAQYTLAGLYVDGVGVVADETQAARWFGEAAKNGHIGAAVEYAIMLSNGRGVPKDAAGAANWIGRAAEADNPVAQLRLARLLKDGTGIDPDKKAAARWYLIAKDQGLEDNDMESWFQGLDEEARKEARAAADDWARLKRGAFQTAMTPQDQPAPVDNSTE